MTVAYAAVHRTLAYQGRDTGLHVLAFETGDVFFSRRQPPLYDAMARPIAPREVPPGSRVNVRYRLECGQRWMHAVQVVRLAEDPPPFEPVWDDGHL
jgi:hypothetical protein